MQENRWRTLKAVCLFKDKFSKYWNSKTSNGLNILYITNVQLSANLWAYTHILSWKIKKSKLD